MLSIDFLMPSFVTATFCIFLPTRKNLKTEPANKKESGSYYSLPTLPLPTLRCPKTSVPKFRFWDFNFALPQRCRSIGCLLFLQHIFLWIAGKQARSHRMLTSGVSEDMCVLCRWEINQRQLSFLTSPFGAMFALKGRAVVNRYEFLRWESMRSFEKLRLIISLRLVSVICSGRHCFHHCLTETGWGSQPSTRDVVENQKKVSRFSGVVFHQLSWSPRIQGPRPALPVPRLLFKWESVGFCECCISGISGRAGTVDNSPSRICLKISDVWRKTRRFLGWKRRYLLPEGGSTNRKKMVST